MDSATFLRLLHEEIGLATELDKKHIIHFPSAQAYADCSRQLNQMKNQFVHLASVRDLAIIQAFSCVLPSASVLKQFPQVKEIEEDTRITVHQVASKRTTGRRSNISMGSQVIPWGVDQVGAPDVWSRSTGQRIRIGVIDTGIDYNHPDLRNSIARGVNLLNRNLLPFDDNGHGTHIAGTIAAASRHNGIIGVAPRAIIHPVKAFDYNGSAYVSDIIAAIDWCVHNELDIINMSFGMKTYNRSLEYAVLNAYYRGTIIIASTGNDGKRKTIDYPARFPQVVAVGATTRTQKIAPFSNRGKQIDVYAPGERIYSAWLHGKYNELSGTSMATAHVSGVVALMLAVKPTLRPQQIKNILRRSSISLSKRASSAGAQPGQINARRVLSALKN
ncbi:S8 family peptidase [Paenibacillus hexagrammi]|uniref:S8 family peptidase n=1 Tax=Paenibacillus hexagrammi TaxID=2908839 RepID=A0ABY3SHW3_9BACL|nr:S8 family peptidase [Paenibacillus sp. YPD9-1]UJF33637.1 S8 family peptidase [Paenibacillus sp. YPD9-1]